MTGNRKKIYYEVHDPHGNRLSGYNWDDAKFTSFKKTINGGFGECIVDFPRAFDNFGEYADVRVGNKVDIFIFDRDLPAGSSAVPAEGRCIYSGYISRYTPYIRNGKQGVTVTLLGHHTKLSQDYYKNGTTTTISETTADIGTIMQNIMARYLAETSNPDIKVDNGNIDAVSQNASYTFKAITYAEAIDVVQRLAPAGWYWYIDSDNFFHFKAKPSTITHHFYYGKEFEEVESDKNMENIVNEVLVYNGQSGVDAIYKKYSDAISQGMYGRRVYKVTDRNFDDETTMDNFAQSILDNYKNPDIEVSLTIIDNNENELGYDIESIEVGDIVKIEGFEQNLFDEGMVITELTYMIDKMTLIIKPMKNDIFNKVYSLDKELEKERAGVDIPADYTT